MAAATFFPKIQDILKVNIPTEGGDFGLDIGAIIGDVYYRDLHFLC